MRSGPRPSPRRRASPHCSPASGTPPQSRTLSADFWTGPSPHPRTRPFTEPLFRGNFEVEQTLRSCAPMPCPPE